MVVEWYIGTVEWSIGTQTYTYKGDKILDKIVELDRIGEVGKKVWSLLTEDERDRYRVYGTYSFIDEVVNLLRIKDIDLTDFDVLDIIHNKIFSC